MKKSEQILGHRIIVEATKDSIAKSPKEAIKWFIKRVKEKLVKSQLKADDVPMPGHMYLYGYDPKTKDKLKYWDAMPLVIPIEHYDNGFLGLNLHYLPPTIRIKLLRSLIDNYAVQSDDKRYIKTSYEKLNGMKTVKFFQPCIKRYLYDHITTPPKRIPPSEWLNAVLLPTAKWRGASSATVYKDSMSL